MTLEELSARAEITDALARYCRAWDRGDLILALSVWHEDGVAQYLDEPAILVRDMIPERLNGRRNPGLRTSHQITNLLVKVRGAAAVSEAYGVSWSQERVGPGLILERCFQSRYLDRWSRRDGRWAIDHRRVLIDGYRIEHFAVEDRFEAIAAASRMGEEDPSYAHFASLT